MSAYAPEPKAIGRLVSAIVSNALELSRRNKILDCIDDPMVRKILIMRWYERSEIGANQAASLIEHHGLENE